MADYCFNHGKECIHETHICHICGEKKTLHKMDWRYSYARKTRVKGPTICSICYDNKKQKECYDEVQSKTKTVLELNLEYQTSKKERDNQ